MLKPQEPHPACSLMLSLLILSQIHYWINPGLVLCCNGQHLEIEIDARQTRIVNITQYAKAVLARFIYTQEIKVLI